MRRRRPRDRSRRDSHPRRSTSRTWLNRLAREEQPEDRETPLLSVADASTKSFRTASAGLHHPHCVDGAGACPPEDCGGGPGHSDLKVILVDPAHEEYHAMLVWLGLRSATEFAPDRFAPDEANARLLRLTAPWKTSRPATPPFAARTGNGGRGGRRTGGLTWARSAVRVPTAG
ncbi:IS1096 element passenger TnpR family protein [Streptomyces sp. NBC_00366]|uniref:IS1096 element passenger TnpR family protein n=1 Tax=Streptomyces sp. NBC_00366 TaxID=2975727 RepID=UPI002E258EA1